jgi:adenylate cyclase class IV
MPLDFGGSHVDSAAQEIEVKYRLIDHDRIEELLAERGMILSEAVIQDDQAYAPTTWRYGMSKQVSLSRDCAHKESLIYSR